MTAAIQTLGDRTSLLTSIALDCLPRAYQHQARLFCFKIVERNGEFLPLGTSIRTTAIAILGLCRAAERGHPCFLRPRKLLDGLLDHAANESLPLGDLGLVLWAIAACDPGRADAIIEEIDWRWRNRETTPDREAITMHLEWLLAGLCAVHSRNPLSQAEDLMSEVYSDLIRTRFNATVGLFHYGSRQQNGLRQRLTRKVCYFAEQVYGIHAFDLYSRSTRDSTAARSAARTAKLLCSHQDSAGGWPWLYNPLNGELVDPYPFYTVHQLGMGPMALLPLSQNGNGELFRAVDRGVQWVFGNHSTPEPLIDPRNGIIWRSIKAKRLPRQSQLLHKALAAAGISNVGHKRWLQPRSFQVDQEWRPYELGWLLYALSDVGKS